MQRENIKNSLLRTLSGDNFVYPDSIRSARNLTCFILKDSHKKYLGIFEPEKMIRKSDFAGQVGTNIPAESISG